MVPVIINNTRKVNCIIEAGVRYCEKHDFTKQELGFVLIITVLIIVWAISFIHFFAEKEWFIGNLILWIPIIGVLIYCFI